LGRSRYFSTDRLAVLIFLASSKQPLTLPPELSWNLKTDRRSDFPIFALNYLANPILNEENQVILED